jgi:hypothetical protein
MLNVGLQAVFLIADLERLPFRMETEHHLRPIREAKPIPHHIQHVVIAIHAEPDHEGGREIAFLVLL